jgi:hypothetical protein
MNVVECDVPSGSVLSRELIERAYFRDSYRAPLSRSELGIVDIFFGIFAHHPLWVKLLLIVRNKVASLAAAMRDAQSIRSDGLGDGRGAKLIWSPLSNLLLYGKTANIYEALAEGVVVSLGTDWNPSGSRNLLGELKVADIALRDPRLLGNSRSLKPEFSTTGKHGEALAEAERALDRELIDMVTRNPAVTVHWQNEVGSIEPGKTADLFVITQPNRQPRDGIPSSPYRSLIDATERDVQLVMVGGDPLVGNVALMQLLKPGQAELIRSSCACYQKAITVTKPGIPKGDETLADIQQALDTGLTALGGDHPPPGGGPAGLTNTYGYLKQHFTLPFPMTDPQFTQLVLIPIAGLAPGDKLNLERLTLTPLLENDDEFFFDVLGARISSMTGLLTDATPPFLLYPSNANQLQGGDNPFAPGDYEDRWYRLPGAVSGFEQPDDGSSGTCVAAALPSCARLPVR